MTCEPYCEMCGGNLGHPSNGDWICSKCKSINEQLAPPRDYDESECVEDMLGTEPRLWETIVMAAAALLIGVALAVQF